jgi:GNAT superfamily N-acetyltransferase
MTQLLERPAARPDAPVTDLTDDAGRHPIRPLRADDVDRMRRFYGRLSAETVYRRYFTPGRPGDAELRRLFDGYPGARDVLVALSGDEVVGLAEGARPRGRPEVVEFGVVVADAWQRSGIGSRLVRALVDRAAASGAVAMRADTLAENRRMARLICRLWPNARPQLDGPLHAWCLPVGRTRQAQAA